MKNRLNKVTGKQASTWMLVLLASLFFIACTQQEIIPPTGMGPAGGEASVTFSVTTPQPTLPKTMLRYQTEAEAHISDVKVLVLEKTGDDYVFSYYISGAGVSSSGAQSHFKATLIGTDIPLKLLLVVNANDVFATAPLRAGMSEATVRSSLKKEFTATGINGDLPMFGEIDLPGGLNASVVQTLSVTVLRAVARIDVVKALNEDSPDFILEEVYAFRANDRIQLIPEELLSLSTPKVAKPSVPADAEFLSAPVEKIVAGGTNEVIQLYLPESQQVADNAERVTGSTTIVIGGRFGGGGSSPVTYYRVDFNSGIDGHPFGQILRNHRYIFNIKKVSAAGWDNPELAANNMASSIHVDVQTWEDFSSEMYLGNDRFGISSREISLRYVKDRKSSLSVESTFNYRIQWLDAEGNLTGSATSSLNTVISNDNFDVTIERNSGDPQNVTHLVFRTRNNNNLGDIIMNKLRITAGSWKIDINVHQDNSAMYSDRFFNILSIEEIGNLGTTGSTYGSGQAMRRVLDKQFAPDGVIKIGGFGFNRVANTTDYPGATTELRLSIMKRLIGSNDIIYFPYNINVSSQVADLLLSWLEGSPHRVLILGTDSNTTNVEIVKRLQDDGTWQFSNIATISTNFKRAAYSDGADDFFAGPFGEIDENASINRADGVAGYNSTYPRDKVTPLITGDRTGYTDYMFFGVNKERRIVYNGDANLFLIDQMSNNSGNVTSNMDKLMANTWAWIVEQVIYGEM